MRASAPARSGRATLEERYDWLPQPIAGLASWFVPAERVGERAEVVRRGQLLVVATLIFLLQTLFAAWQIIDYAGRVGPSSATLLLCCALVALNPFLMRWTGSIRLAGALMTVEVFAGLAFVAYLGDGLLDGAFLPTILLPWLAAILIDPRAGLAVTLLVIAEAAFFLRLLVDKAEAGTLLIQLDGIYFLGLSFGLVTVAMGLLSWMYEGLTFRALYGKNRDLAEAHRDLARSEAKMRALVQKGSDVISLVDRQGRVLYQSPTAERILGHDIAPLSPDEIKAHIHPEDQEQVRAAFLRLVGPGAPPELRFGPFRYGKPDGEWIWVECVATNLLNDPDVNAIVINTRDVSVYKRAEEEATRARLEAERLMQVRTTFLSNMSHEVRTPLAGIAGYATLLSEETEGRQHEFATLILASGQRLLATLNSILDFARLEADELKPVYVPVDLVREARQAVALLQPLAAEKGLALRLETDAPRLDARLDATFVNRILNNLVGNAIKFTEQGEVTVRLSADAAHVRLAVVDTGRGIAESFRALLFEAFKREPSGDVYAQEGSGLGLAITQRLVRMMQGEIAVESEPGRGSTFTVTLPREPVRPDGDGARSEFAIHEPVSRYKA